MPDPVQHTVFGKEVRERLSPEARNALVPEPYSFALYGPDPWFGYKPWIRREGRGRAMHTIKTGTFLTALAEQAKTGKSRAEMYSYLAGFLCHYALDTAAHPYIIRRTETDYPVPRAHMGFEHELDERQMARDGHAGEAHPLTDHYYLDVRLPAVMEEDLNRVYETVYGWKDCFRELNRSARIFRLFFRKMENPRGLPGCLARHQTKGGLRSLTYTNSYFRDADVENEGHEEWAHSHDGTILSRESFAELKEKGAKRAVRMIEAAYRYIYKGDISKAELAEIIGNDSYLSGLPLEDPRNMTVKSMLPPEYQT